jgi:lysophospholipase L1-like esterase
VIGTVFNNADHRAGNFAFTNALDSNGTVGGACPSPDGTSVMEKELAMIFGKTRKVRATSVPYASLILLFATAIICGLTAPQRASAGVLVQSGQKVAFLGDSITGFGWSKPAGWVHLVVDSLTSDGVVIQPIPSGYGGNTSTDMASRIDTDILAKKPDWVLLCCGANDVWKTPTLAQYEANVTSMVKKCQASHIKVMLLTVTPVVEDLSNSLNIPVANYNTFLRQFALQNGCVLAETNVPYCDALAKKTIKGNALTVDGIHMNPAGDFIIATAVLKAFGLSDKVIEASRARWLTIPDGVPLDVTVQITPQQWFELRGLAAKQGEDVPTFASALAVPPITAEAPAH